MPLARFYLLGFGLLSLAFGLAYLLSPAGLTEAADFGSLSPAASTDIRATYGGFQLGMGLFLLWSSRSAERYAGGLLLVVLVMGLVLASRALGLLLDGGPNDFHKSALVFESLLTLTSFAVWRRVR